MTKIKQTSEAKSVYASDPDIDQHDLDMVAFFSEPSIYARNTIFDIDLHMRRSYAALKSDLILKLSPVIIVNNDSRGGEYTLIHNGVQESVQPVSQVFEMTKSISHVPLGIFSIIAPYLKAPSIGGWQAPLKEFAVTLTTALEHLKHAQMPENAEVASKRILKRSLAFIEKSLKAGDFSIKGFEKYAASVFDAIRVNMQYASMAQIEAVNTLIGSWKAKVGEQEWKKLYTVVLSIWTTSVENQNTIILRTLMDPDNLDTHLIDIPTAEFPDDPVFVALDNLARIVQDNVAAEMIFPSDQEIADALKGTEDLLSGTILKLLDCPYQGTSAKRETECQAAGKPGYVSPQKSVESCGRPKS